MCLLPSFCVFKRSLFLYCSLPFILYKIYILRILYYKFLKMKKDISFIVSFLRECISSFGD